MENLTELCFLCLNDDKLSNVPLDIKTADQVKHIIPEFINPKSTLHICRLCVTMLQGFYKFKNMCLENYNRMKMYLDEVDETKCNTEHQNLIDAQTIIEHEKQQDLSNANIQENIEDISINIKKEVDDENIVKTNEELLYEEEQKCFAFESVYVNEDYAMDDQGVSEADKSEIDQDAVKTLLPAKSRAIYEKEYNAFNTWCQENNIRNITENILLVYYEKMSKEKKSSSLWASYSMLRACLNIYRSVDISKFTRLQAFLKRQAAGYQPKKSNVLEKAEIDRFLNEADDLSYLAMKVILIMGYAGACRRDELTRMSIDDIVYKEDDTIIVSVPKTRTSTPRLFAISEMHWIHLIKRYTNLRPKNVATKRFFLTYRNGRCIMSPIGINKMSQVPRIIATFLKLPHPERYTGHCFRRSRKLHRAI